MEEDTYMYLFLLTIWSVTRRLRVDIYENYLSLLLYTYTTLKPVSPK